MLLMMINSMSQYCLTLLLRLYCVLLSIIAPDIDLNIKSIFLSEIFITVDIVIIIL